MNIVRNPLAWALGVALFEAAPSQACSLVDVMASQKESISISGHYMLASIVICLVTAVLDLYERRVSVPLVVSIALVVFHPRWTVAPLYETDCSFINVFASQLAITAIAGLLGYRTLRLYRRLPRRSVT